MMTVKPIIVFIMLFVLSLCDDPPELDGTPEEFLKEVNEYRAKFAKEHRVPNMYKMVWSNEFVEQHLRRDNDKFIDYYSGIHFTNSYRNPAGLIEAEVEKFKKKNDLFGFDNSPAQLINPLQTFIGCTAEWLSRKTEEYWIIYCSIGPGRYINYQYADPGEAGSQCPPRFKGENGLCVPVDPSKHTFWGTEDQLLEDVNYMRRKYAKKFGIPNMHQLTWNESLVEILKNLDLKKDYVEGVTFEYVFSSDSSWDGVGKHWRITDELLSFSSVVAAIDEAVHSELKLKRRIWRAKTKGEQKELITAKEMIHPLQTSIGCLRKIRIVQRLKFKFTACLLGNMGQWPSNWKLDINSTKIPGSECMDGYVNDDGLCVVAPPTTTPGPTTPTTPEATTTPETTQKTTPKEAETVPGTSMKPDASDEKKEKEGVSVEEDAELEPGQEALESSSVTTRNYSYGPWIFVFICLLF